ncbi:meiosis-specific protein MEI4-like [Mercenaria mercenaria]|uniref:meiosis-specific protein MEI4-like n=1 Tax=Mercenaria mercenaria TaxID=6596 RepID=UPI00234F0060|nr:meiosis-specific protein MEI4-like [Mercenaria mercenaria]
MEEDVTGKENVQAMKVAVALAVLRNKPPGVSGRRYAEVLCEKFRASQLHWKQQYERAGAEILHLKQELLMRTQTQQPEKVQASSSQIFEDSLPPDSQPLFPTPPPSGSAGPSQCTSISSSDAQFSLAKHTEFLHHVINIQTASKILASDRPLQDITQQSLLHSLQILQTHIGSDEISWTVQEQCVQTIVAVVNHSNKHIFDCVLEEVASLCTHIIEHIMSYSKPNYKVLDKKSHLLSSFIDCKQFTPTLLRLLFETIYTYSDSLKQCVKDKEQLDPNRFCNIYYIIKAAENCLRKKGSEVNLDEKQCIRTNLEESFLFITERFPLFVHAVWRLCVLLT